MERRTFFEDMKTELQAQTFNLFPERWRDLYFKDVFPGAASMAEAQAQRDLEVEVPVSIDELDEFYNNLDKPRKLTGADVPDNLFGAWQ